MLDDGTVSGVSPKAVASIERNIVNVANDPSMFNVAPALEFERLEGGGGKTVIRVWVPMGPALYSFKGTIYDRAADVDVKVKTEAQHAAMIIRKQSFYTEKTVYPWVPRPTWTLSSCPMVRGEVRAARAGSSLALHGRRRTAEGLQALVPRPRHGRVPDSTSLR